MAEYRLIGVSPAGRTLQTSLIASNRFDIKKKALELSKEKNIQVTKIQKKIAYRYKVQRGTEKPISGEQKAFSQDEVQNALTKMGFQIIRLERNWLDFKMPVPVSEIVMLIRIIANLLKEKYPFNEILQLIQTDIENKTLRQTIRDINQDLKAGKEGFEVYNKHEKVLGKFTTYMLSVASTSGNMYKIYESTAKFLERQQEFKKDIRSAIITPLVTMVICIAAIGFFVCYIFPKLTTMLVKYKIDIPPMTQFTMDINNFVQNHYIMIFFLITIPTGALIYYFKTLKGKYYLDCFILKIPVLGTLLHKTSIEIFCRVFSSIYSGSGENISVIRIAAEACRNTYIEQKIKDIAIPQMLKKGKGFVESLAETGVFPNNALSRLRSGEESGTLQTAAYQIADYYEKETTHKMKGVVEFINFTVSIIVMLMIIGLTLVSSEIGFITPNTQDYFNY